MRCHDDTKKRDFPKFLEADGVVGGYHCKHCTCPCCLWSVHDSVKARVHEAGCVETLFSENVETKCDCVSFVWPIFVGLPATIQHQCMKDWESLCKLQDSPGLLSSKPSSPQPASTPCHASGTGSQGNASELPPARLKCWRNER